MFAGVNALNINGISKIMLRWLSELSTAMMIHAKKRWPSSISANLWLYSLNMETEVFDEISSIQYIIHRTQSHKFSGSKVM